MSGKGDKQRKSQVSSKRFEKNWDAVFGTSTSERIAEQLLEEDKALCDRLNKQTSLIFSDKVSKFAVKDLNNGGYMSKFEVGEIAIFAPTGIGDPECLPFENSEVEILGLSCNSSGIHFDYKIK